MKLAMPRPYLLSALLVSALAALAVPAGAKDGGDDGGGSGGGDGVELIQFLHSTGVDGNGTCRGRWRQKDGVTRFDVELEDVAAGEYELWVAGVLEGGVTVGTYGEGETEFVTPKDGNKPLLDFAVLNQPVQIRQGATTFFDDTFTGAGGGGSGSGGSGGGTKTEVFFVNVGPDGNAHGSLRYEAKPDKTRFSVRVEHLDAGSYQLAVGGTAVADLVSTGLTEVELEFQAPVEPGKLLLDFDPLGQRVDVVAGGIAYLSAVLPGSSASTGVKPPSTGKQGAKDLGKGKGDALSVVLHNTGLLAGASGKVELSKSGETELEVEVEHLVDGDYGLRIGGADVATIVVAANHGEVKFSTSPEAAELPLGFEVQGRLVEVTSAAGTILAVVFPVSVQAALGTWAKEVHVPQHLRVNLAASGVDLDGRALADFRDRASHDTLVIRAVDLPAGGYDVILDGVVQPGALVVTKADGKDKAVFDTQPKGGQLPLAGVVPGTTVQITPAGDDATVLFSGTIE